MRGGRRGLTEQDRAEWARYVRQVRAFAGRARPPESPAAGLARPIRTQQHRPASKPSLSAVSVGQQPPGVDNATWRRLRSGKFASVRTLDLHGRSAQRAFAALSQFLRSAQADRIRCVEVITGRGSGEAGGVLRRELPLWLNLPELRPLVLGLTYSHVANPGAVRILLRKGR